MFYVYILYSEPFNKYYVGHTNDMQRRLLEHNELSLISYTSKYRPWKLMAQIEISETRDIAMKVEKYIKSQKRKSFIELVIQKSDDVDFVNYLKKKSSVGRA
jgi:putative endonuclease